ncbi:hypothetical protein [Streptomyces virginiae]|uniref:hypothetical protein n=1 Tax=Streptomyces virginiae TaxID=1961 RepID=UPI002DBC41F3|nr:hypothetical protein [Streptomyces sp. CMAA1738]MEC4575073.1 hypothetical protein [Streptomyces sp. CMAA1738]
MKSSARTLPAALLSLALTAALSGVATAPAHAAAPAPCGTKVSDYTGTVVADSAFTGKISLAQDGLPDRDITITPASANSTLVNIEIKISPTETTSATGNFTLRVNPINQGGITFPTYAGPLGQTTSVACNLSSRVVAMTGRISTTGVKGDRVFTVTR